jgi:hypothetical protein
MMSPDERQLLAGLFDRTRAASANPRDKEAEAFIAEAVREQPYATYLLAQAVIVQDQALGAANEKLQQLEARIHELEAAQANNSGSFLGGLFGGGRPAAPTSVPSAGAAPAPTQQAASPWGRQQAAPTPQQYAQSQYGQPMQQPQQQGGGFLKGALGAAAGVAGGMLLANSISNLFSNHGNNSLGIGSGLGAGDSNQASLGGNQGAGDSGGLMGGIFPASYNESSEDSGFYGSSDDLSDI